MLEFYPNIVTRLTMIQTMSMNHFIIFADQKFSEDEEWLKRSNSTSFKRPRKYVFDSSELNGEERFLKIALKLSEDKDVNWKNSTYKMLFTYIEIASKLKTSTFFLMKLLTRKCPKDKEMNIFQSFWIIGTFSRRHTWKKSWFFLCKFLRKS